MAVYTTLFSGRRVHVPLLTYCRNFDSIHSLMKRQLSLGKVVAGIVAVAVLLVIGLVDRKFRLDLGSRVVLIVHPLKISGTVTDAQSGEPVSGLTVTPGSPFGDRYAWGTAVNYPAAVNRYEEVFRSPLTVVTRSTGGPARWCVGAVQRVSGLISAM